ncbi:hypothetical protein E1218_15335 [Kribbella turkmenica]|uniref:Uncharacterized protein n=1 Tax=Kribbella turkmenica TaxID=2530375 RepID=A0A4V2YFZ9_9ACTN|nr:hypothetical protein [Kribbella turkmenica]TDD25177.1 hypothetical protein E1218_15335 [Kribbella turkmenica]
MAVAGGLGVGTTGVLTGVLLFGPLAASILLAVVFALVWPLAAVIRHVADDAPYRSAVVVAGAAAAGVLCLPGLVRLMAWGAIGLAVALLVAGLFILIDLVTPERRTRPSRSQRTLEELKQAELQEDEQLIASLKCPLSIEELCGLWTETATQLAQGAGPRDRQAVAEVRRICLDEFERRNPAGFHRWLDAGAPANPSSYLLPTPGE